MADSPTSTVAPSTSEGSSLSEPVALSPPVAASCPPCPLVQAKLSLGEPVSNLCNTNCADCGDGICNNGETHETCSPDCPLTSPPRAVCGNGVCETGETASSCPRDCAPPVCGNGRCETGERTTCPEDCCALDNPPCPL